MKSLLVACSIAVFSAGFTPLAVEAKRLGGGSSSGMQRSMPAQTPPGALPARPAQQAAPAAPAGATAAAAAAAPKRSWLGPIAGLAAGFGIAALMSHMGFGEGLANFVTILLLALVAFVAIRFLMRRFGKGGPALAAAGPQNGAFGAAPMNRDWNGANAAPATTTAFGASPPATPFGASSTAPAGGTPAWAPAAVPAQVAPSLPPGFDQAGFERIAKTIFIRMQAANDQGDLNDLRTFTTPEMFASIRLELQERGATKQQTDVERVEAQVLEVASETDRQIVSVRFHGLIRETANGPTEPFDEVWHLVKPADGSREWAIAGIQQTQTA